METAYGFGKTVTYSFEHAVNRVTEELQKEASVGWAHGPTLISTIHCFAKAGVLPKNWKYSHGVTQWNYGER